MIRFEIEESQHLRPVGITEAVKQSKFAYLQQSQLGCLVCELAGSWDGAGEQACTR